MTYKEQLQTKEWKLKRKGIIKRDKCCLMCGDTKQLEVHHTYYDFGLMAWEYEDEYLLTLCNLCHKRETYEVYHLKQMITDMLKSGMFAHEIVNKIRD